MKQVLPYCLIVLSLVVLGCEKVEKRDPGDVFSVNGGNGGYKAVKILDANDSLLFCKVYSNSFQWRPKSLDDIALTTRYYGARDVVVLYRAVFEGWHPQPLGMEPVKSEEQRLVTTVWKNNPERDTLLIWQRMSNSELPEVDYGTRDYWKPKK